MTPAIITDVTREQFEELRKDMRHLDRDVLAAVGCDPEQELEDSWQAATTRKLIIDPNTRKPLGIWLSMYPYMDDKTALWTLLTFNQLDKEIVAFVRNTRTVIPQLFALEPVGVNRACSVMPLAFERSLAWHVRVIKSKIIFNFDFKAQPHVMVEMRKEWY
jgi:hypothetical protein